VARTFSPEAKARALEMVANIQAVMRERLTALAWMSDATRQQALAKLDAFVNKIGYPDKWIDYGPLEVRPGDAFATNVMRADRFAVRRNLDKLGKPVDRGEWVMSPPTVNAYYNPPFNEIVFPAGILQPPFFDPNADDAVNYGGMGAVIGHEITHGFDDQGRQYDAQGNLRDWWTKEDAERFTKRADIVVAQFGGYTIGDTATKVNGKLTLGENIADLGGLTIAYHALQKSMQKKGRPAPVDGFTPEQRFFLAWAQIWRTNTRPEFARLLANVDPHAPGKWRTNGPLGNMPEFAKAWGCKAGDRMVRADTLRAEIW
jgi:putative endopeptidase